MQNAAEIRDKVEKELEPDTIVKMQEASRERYNEFKSKESTEDKKEIKKINAICQVVEDGQEARLLVPQVSSLLHLKNH